MAKPLKENEPVADHARKDKPSAKELTDFHTHDDVDGSPKAHHHTLGPGHNQAASGDHNHDGGGSAILTPLEGITLTGSRDGNVALASVIAALVTLGATDATTP